METASLRGNYDNGDISMTTGQTPSADKDSEPCDGKSCKCHLGSFYHYIKATHSFVHI